MAASRSARPRGSAVALVVLAVMTTALSAAAAPAAAGDTDAPEAAAPLQRSATNAAVDLAYPTPLPNFAHPGEPHYEYFDPTGGRNDRPMLVIYEYFNESPIPPGKGAAWMFDRFFRVGFPSVRGYFRSASHGQMVFNPAYETRGTRGDGIVIIDSGSYAAWTDRSSEENNRRALIAANPYVNYASFNRNDDSVLTLNELTIMKVEVHPDDDDGMAVGGGAAARGVNATTLDGMALGAQIVGLANTATNQISIDHEVMHTAFNLERDWYQFGIDSFDIMGATISPREDYYRTGAWHSMHLGWTYPTVVTKDGYYNVPDWETGGSFLLYDPAKGTDHYFMVENRVRRPNSYEQDVGDSGLNVWRVDESHYYDDDAALTPIRRIRPCQGDAGCPTNWYWHAFDPLDSRTPRRSMTAQWNDGTNAAVAIRAMHGAAENMKVYFDVPGPGVLVDCFDTERRRNRIELEATAGRPLSVQLPVRNTGTEAGTFDFIVDGMPGGWTATQDLNRSLPPGLDAMSNITLRPAPTASGVYTVNITGRWTQDHTYVSGCSFNVRVAPTTLRGYVWANSPTLKSYQPAGAWQSNSSGASNTVTRALPGQYRVRFANLGVDEGVVHATAYGAVGATCKVERWDAANRDLLAAIRCFDSDGNPYDTRFTASFVRPVGLHPFGHLFADQPTTPSYRPQANLSYNSTSATNHVRRLEQGSYRVWMPGLIGADANVQVTAYGTGPARCRVTDWRNEATERVVDVRCARLTGEPVDSQFTLTFSRNSGVTGLSRPAAHVRADEDGDSYQPATQFNSAGLANSVEQVGTGRYDVTLRGLGATGGHVAVTAMRAGECHPVSWGPVGKAQVVRVACYGNAGAPKPNHFSLSYVD